MSRKLSSVYLCLVAALLVAAPALAEPILATSEPGDLYTSASPSGMALADSLLLMGPWGSGAPENGQFQDISGNTPAWNGWTHVDATEPEGGGELGVGDFTRIWMYLEEIDLCVTNYSPQVAFIDDGTVVPGAGPSECLSWCYGPGGYVVNTTGGRFGDPYPNALHNWLISPVMTWPGGLYDGMRFDFDAYMHQLIASPDSPLVAVIWSVRSATDPAAIEEAPWVSRDFFYYGGPAYMRFQEEVGDLLVPGCQAVQVMVGVRHLSLPWITPLDATPGPYYDNVRVTAYQNDGPFLTAYASNLAQDAFPAAGALDSENLANNNVRFDSAYNGNYDAAPGDSLVCRIATRRPGAELTSTLLRYSVQRNEVFDAVRDPAWGETGSVAGIPVEGVDGLFAFDLPDEGFLFPGDIIHYYFEASDAVNGADPRTHTLPADLSGFGDFSDPRAYEAAFTMRALPSIEGPEFHQPLVLFWDDSGGSTDLDKWLGGFGFYGLHYGQQFDIYQTNAASSSLGNGLGGRATPEVLAGYEAIFYSSGDLTATLEDGWANPSEDVQLLSAWLDEEARHLFLCGDNLASDLQQSTEGSAFLADYLNVQLIFADIRSSIGGQTAPLVRHEYLNPVLIHSDAWIAFGGCPNVNAFDGVVTGPDALRLARFCDYAGQPSYDYAAATLNILPNGSRVVSMPVDMGFIYTDHSNPPPFGTSNMAYVLMRDVLSYFGIPPGPVGGASQTQAVRFQTANHPNPFNPVTRIDYTLPRDGRIAIRVYNVRGELVRTLIDEEKPAGDGHVLWDGTGASGEPVGSGVYFYEARHDGQVTVNKMTLVK